MDAKARSPTTGQYIKIPRWLLARKDVSLATKVVWAVIVDAMRGKGFSYPGQRKIAALIGVSINVVCRAVEEIKRLKLLQVEPGGKGKPNVYRLISTVSESTTPVSETKTVQSVSESGGRCLRIGDPGASESETKKTNEKTNEKTKTTAPQKPPRKRNLIWDAVEAEFYPSGVPKSHGAAFGKIVADYVSVGATPTEIHLRAKRYREGWPTAACTARALVKHWDQFSEDVSKRDTKTSRVHARAGKYDGLKVHRSG